MAAANDKMIQPPQKRRHISLPAVASFPEALKKALTRREPWVRSSGVEGFRIFSADADGVGGVFIDVYGPGAVLILHEGRTPSEFDALAAAELVLETLRPIGVRAVYLKIFAKDRSRLGGERPVGSVNPMPAAGEALPEFFCVRETIGLLEVRLYDGLSTGLFLDKRSNREFVADWIRARIREAKSPVAMLNTFAYTCAFSVAAATAGALTTSVDVSARYFAWGQRNFAHNAIDLAPHRFARMDTFEFLSYALRKSMTYDLIVLDPPSFGSGSKRKGIRPWSAVSDYARLVSEASRVLRPGGLILASTNTTELCQPGRLDAQIIKALGRAPRWVKLPPIGLDYSTERERFSDRAFTL